MLIPAKGKDTSSSSPTGVDTENHDYLEEARLAFKGHNFEEAIRLFKLALAQTGYKFSEANDNTDPEKPTNINTPIADILSNEQEMPWVIYNPTKSNSANSEVQDLLSSIPDGSLVRQASAANDLAFVYLMTGDFSNAEPLLQHALKVRTQICGSSHPKVAQTLNNLGGLYYSQKDYKSALNFFALATTIWAKLHWPENKDADLSLKNYLALLKQDGKSKIADDLETEVQTIRSSNSKSSGLVNHIPDGSLWSTYVFAGQQELQQGKVQESEQFFKKALKEAQIDDPNSKKVADSLQALATFYQGQKRYSEAEDLYLSTLDLMQKQVDWQPTDFLPALDNLASIYMEQHRYSDAEPILKQLADIKGKAEESKRWGLGQVLSNLALVLLKQHKYEDSDRVCKQILDIYQDPNQVDYIQSMQALAKVYQEQGKNSKADDLYGRALAEIKQSDGDGSRRAATIFKERADHYKEQKKWADALPLYERALEIFGKNSSDSEIIYILDGYSTCLIELKKNSEAEVALKRELNISATDEKTNWQLKLDALSKLSRVCKATGKIKLSQDLQIQQIEERQKQLEQLKGAKLAEAKQKLAEDYINAGAYKNALPLMLDIVNTLYEKRKSLNGLYYALWLDKLANVQLNIGQSQEAIANSNQVVHIIEHYLGGESQGMVVALRHYAQTLAYSGNLGMASNASYRADKIEQTLRTKKTTR